MLIHEERTHQNTEFAQSIDYGYDLTGQLIDAIFSGQNDEHFEYDANGNRTFSRNGDEERTYTTGPANQLESDSVYRYEYDGEGNQIKRVHLETGETRTFQYDHRNRLVRVDDWSSDPGDPNNPDSRSPFSRRRSSTPTTRSAGGLPEALIADGEGPQSAEREFFVYNGDNVWSDVAH